ncbi:metallophosphatase family protein [Methanocella sp. CWC-04]|uniref:Metallophosphatase family protein n=1 Tax=Methanooceanicella nereidis TaxID=2052831 RepID=A0AAP2REI2_9EURY|nr:metallophosphoesterase [Methanocella sp. CWC-04]MCD1294707.1 metallophosphatase family protein [Methanocella sp. CWC-04]
MAGSILLISDIHADAGALDAILRVAGDDKFSERYGNIGKVINLGDVMERGYLPKETVNRLKTIKNLISILGNHDEAFLNSKAVTKGDAESIRAHDLYRNRSGYQAFFKGMEKYHIDREYRLLAVHGGPLDPLKIYHGDFGEDEAWLHSRTWQRITTSGSEYCDSTGYHYLPESAFNSVKKYFDNNGFVIVCGHEHKEAAYRQTGDEVEDILHLMDKDSFVIGNRRIDEKKIEIDESSNYLIRLGIAGPAGYYRRYGWDRCYFGVISKTDKRRSLSMLSFQLGRDLVPP